MEPNPDRLVIGPIAAVLRRLGEGLLTAWAAVSLAFFALRIAIGDPAASLLSQGLVTPAQLDQIREVLGLNAPLWQQYLTYLTDLVRGDLGVSLYTQQSVSSIIAQQLPATVTLASLGWTLGIVFGLMLGILAAWKRRSLLKTMAAVLSGLGTALPVAFTGVLALYLVRWSTPHQLPRTLTNLWVPASVLAFATAGAIGRVTRTSLEESIEAPYILAARARGIRRNLRLLWHALRPALPPVVSLSALEAAFLFSGTVVTETVFSRPGLGRLLVSSILRGDYPVALGLVALAAIFYTASLLIGDLMAMALDPRLRRTV
jgi:ABC-type dipeptide/oligopeptide/nickel transport system permease component